MSINVNEHNGSKWVISKGNRSWLVLLYFPFYVLYMAFFQDRLPSFLSAVTAIGAFLISLILINTYLRYRATKLHQ